MGTKTVILGGGAGGIVVANVLRSKLGKEHSVVVIERGATFHLGAANVWVMLGEKQSKDVEAPLDGLRKRGIDLITAEVRKIDAARREVTTSGGTVTGDFLVLALGVDLNLGAVPGLAQAAHTFYTMTGAIKLGEEIRKFGGGDILILNPKMPIKCPPAPYEMAMHLDHVFTERKMRDKVRIAMATVEPTPVPTAGACVSDVLKAELAFRNVAYHPLKKVKSADAAKRAVLFEDGSEMKYDLLISVPPHEAPKVVREAGLTSAGGWIPVDPKSLKTSIDRVWAIGDVTTVPLPGRYKPDAPLALPKAAVFAEAHGKIVAEQIAALASGGTSAAAFDGKGFCFVEMGAGRAMGGDGFFFETPAPKVVTRAPDEAQHAEKIAWASRFLKDYLL